MPKFTCFDMFSKGGWYRKETLISSGQMLITWCQDEKNSI